MINKIFVDLDCTVADFWKSPMFDPEKRSWSPPEMFEPGFFETLTPMNGALSGLRSVLAFAKENNIKVYILTKPVATTFYSYSEKAAWVNKWFPELFDKVILCQDKELLSGPGNILIDDHLPWKELWEIPGGTFIQFEELRSSLSYWRGIVETLKELNK